MIPDRFAPVLAELAPLADRFAAAGHRLYLVGGAVRDLLVGVGPVGDLDLTTDARPDQIKALLNGWADAVWAVGERFGTVSARKGDRTVEISTHRSADARATGAAAYGDDIDTDLRRRDFTVNALALALPGPELIDPCGGAIDLATKRLRTPVAARETFTDDPLRMLRGARLIAALGLEPDPDVVAAATELAPLLAGVAPERVRAELDKLIVVPRPGPGLWFCIDTGLATHFLPELPAMRLEQDPIHRHKDVLTHTIAVVENVQPDVGGGRYEFDFRRTRLAALLHDVGKPKTRSIRAGKGVSFHHHEVVGARMTRDRLQALRYSGDDVEAITELVELHLRFHTYQMGWTDSAVRRYVRDAGPLLHELNVLTRSDCTTRNERKAVMLSKRMDELERRIDELAEREQLESIRPDLDGNQVMTHLGVRPGPIVGEALGFLLELRLDEGPLGEEEAYRRLDAWWAARAAD